MVAAPRRYILPSSIAAVMEVELTTVQRWIRNKQLPAVNIGTGKIPRYRIYREDFMRFLIARGNTEKDAREVAGLVIRSPRS